MNKLKKLRTSLLLPAELVETINSYLAVIEEGGEPDAFVQVITELLKADVILLGEALTAVRVNALVTEVAQLDAVRDDLYIGFRDMVDAAKRRRDDALLAAYAKVWPVIEKAGTTLYSLGYTAQSGRLEVLFAELDKADHQEALNTLGLTAIYAELKQAQQDFSSKYSERLDEDSKKSYPTLGEAKKQAVPHVNILIDAISILEEATPTSQEGMISRMNAITFEIMSVARARKTRSETVTENSFAA